MKNRKKNFSRTTPLLRWPKLHLPPIATYFGISILIASLLILSANTVFLRNLELLTLDLLFQFRPARPTASTNIVIIEATAEDLQRYGRWPWPRRMLGELITDLKMLGAKTIVLDLLASEPSTPADDNAMARAIEQAGNVYMPYGFTTNDYNYEKGVFSIPQLREKIKGTGSVNLHFEGDGKIRRVPLFFIGNGQLYSSLILQLVLDYEQARVKSVSPDALVLSGPGKDITIPLTGNSLILNWRGKWKDTFPRYSVSDIWMGLEKISRRMPPDRDLGRIKNSISIVAVTAHGLYDTRPNALESQYPGSGIIATALTGILERDFLKLAPEWLNLFVVYLFALVPLFYIFNEKFSRYIFMTGFILGGIVLAYFIFLNNYILNFSLPFVTLMASYIAVSAFHEARISLDRKNLLALATTDGLTGLYNIRYFREILKAACLEAAKDPANSFYLVLCDIDHFKGLNDRYGHQAGDYALQNVSHALKSSVRANDVTARYGGDEMILLLRTTSETNALNVAEKIRNRVENLNLRFNQQPLPVTVSIGVARFDPARSTESSTIQKTDHALLKAKKEGRNRVVLG